MSGPAHRPAILVKGYPRLSETFIAQELLALQRKGLRFLIVSLRHPTDRRMHALNREITAPVLYLPEYLYQEPVRVLRALLRQLWQRTFWRAARAWLLDLVRDLTPNRGRRFGQALVLATELPAEIDWLHVHYLHTPGSVSRYTAILRGLPFSVSAHAKDVWTIPAWEKREKLAAAAWVVTCSRMNWEHLRALAPESDIELVYHGLDVERFPPPTATMKEEGPVVIASVARAVEKKGLDVLLEALALLPPELDWRFEHVGGGPLADGLRRQAERLGIENRVRWLGSGTQDEVLAALRRADIFCLAARIAKDGDRDGLPNVVMEAMSQALPVVATEVAAIPEIVQTGVTGLLVPPEQPRALAEALARLIRDADKRRAMGLEGRRRVIERFSFEAGIERLAERFGLTGVRREAA